jgi:tetratricopeptide (TPR) repeat protein
VTIYIKNEGDKAISTNPLDWYLLIGGLKYSYDSATFDSSINHLTYDVMKGGETETIIVYLVKGNPSTATLKYDQLFGPELKYIDHYILSQSGKSDEAIKAYEKAIEFNPQNAYAWDNKGIALGRLNKSDEAIKAFDKAIEINPQNSGAWGNKGNALADLNKPDEAIKAFDKAIEINPHDPDTWNDKGLSLDALGKYDDAILAYSKAIEINPQYADAWYKTDKGRRF